MRARCGACGSTIEVPGAGRFQCPACGQLNEVRPAPTAEQPPMSAAPPPAPPERPSTRLTCPECDFSFIIGEAATVTCPNCRTEVPVELDSS